jgi:hypothetical protein
LFTEKWLYTYESIIQNWLTPTRQIIEGHKYFELLKNQNVSFYDTTKQIETRFELAAPPPPVAPIIAGGGGGDY